MSWGVFADQEDERCHPVTGPTPGRHLSLLGSSQMVHPSVRQIPIPFKGLLSQLVLLSFFYFFRLQG